MAEELPASGRGAAAHALHALGQCGGSGSRYLRTVQAGAWGGEHSLAVGSSRPRPAARGRARTFVALGGAASGGRHSGSPSAAAGQAAAAGGAAGGALCAGHLATAPRQRSAGRADALGCAGAGSGSSPGSQRTLALDAADHLPGGELRRRLRKGELVHLALGIEVYHRTLKSGCRIEQRQLGKAERIEACLAIDLVVAWRIFHLTKLGREVPDVPCSVYFEEAEWKALVAYTTQ